MRIRNTNVYSREHTNGDRTATMVTLRITPTEFLDKQPPP